MLDAVDFCRAAELLLNRGEAGLLPVFFLFARSMELALKAFLLDAGVKEAQFKKRDFGHNLAGLLKHAEARGLSAHVSLLEPERGMVELLAREYTGTRLGYRVTGETYCLPPIDHTEDIARRLIGGLTELCNASDANFDG
jgi:HEPN domain-containing protein